MNAETRTVFHGAILILLLLQRDTIYYDWIRFESDLGTKLTSQIRPHENVLVY